jgi:hypothetical protein
MGGCPDLLQHVGITSVALQAVEDVQGGATSAMHVALNLDMYGFRYTVAVLNVEALGSRFVGENSKAVSMVLGSFPQKKESQVVQ